MHNENLIAANSKMAVRNAGREFGVEGKFLHACIYQHKIVTRSVHLVKRQGHGQACSRPGWLDSLVFRDLASGRWVIVYFSFFFGICFSSGFCGCVFGGSALFREEQGAALSAGGQHQQEATAKDQAERGYSGSFHRLHYTP
jgi:hypothetical protein